MSLTLAPVGHWLPVRDGDPRALALFKRHYSYRRRAPGRLRGNSTFVGQGEKMVLLTSDCLALFAWQRSTVERASGQTGINCTVFRNEGPILSSTLIREADDLAWARWPGERHFSYVNADKVRHKRDPGRCFLKAGWTRCGTSKAGLLIFERLP